MNGMAIIVMIRSLGFSSVLVAMMAGTPHPKPVSRGMNDLPCKPILCISLSMMKAARAI